MLLREGDNVVARDIHSLDSLGTVVAGAADLWFVGRWKPTTSANVLARGRPRARATARCGPHRRRRRPRLRQESRATRRGPRRAPAPPADQVWVQVSVSQNEKASRDLAAEIGRSGHAAQVIAPRSPGDGWRVVVGPYPTRSAADSAGRLLGRPFYILERGLEGPVRQ